jgi:hypothetical protein
MVTIGQNNNGQWFIRGLIGVGLGGSFSIDPKAQFPKGNEDPPCNRAAIIGFRGGAGLNIGPLGSGVEAAEGVHISYSAYTGRLQLAGYSEPLSRSTTFEATWSVGAGVYGGGDLGWLFGR